ncbi:Non-catalytic module family DOC2, partial [Piromyces sp. E2]
LLTTSLVTASRSDFYGENDNRPELFKILDDHIGTIKITLEDDDWAAMKNMTVQAPWGAASAPRYETNKGSMEFFVDGTDYKVELNPGDFVFGLGGSGSRNYVKPGFNIKLKKKKTVYEVKSLRLRANIRDPTLMREKLSSDIFYKMGIPATSANYVNMIVNGEDFGIFILTNKIKKDFIKRYYNDDNPVNLFECKDAGSRFENNGVADLCGNVDEEINDQRDDIRAFNDAVNAAKTVEELEKVLDVDQFLRIVAFELLTDSWDHFLSYSHNNFWYKGKDGKWLIFLKDYDETFGNNFNSMVFEYFPLYADRTYVPKEDLFNIANMSLRDLDFDHPFLKYLLHEDDTRLRKIIGEYVKKVFNPKVLLPRIDEIAELIRDDITSSRSLDENGFGKGYSNVVGFNPRFNGTHFEDCLGYGNYNSNVSHTITFGLRYYIEERFRYICHTYGIDPETLELIEPRPKVAYWGIKNKYKVKFEGNDFFKDDQVRFTYPDLDKEDYMQEEYNADPEKNNKPSNYVIPPFKYEKESSSTTTTTAPEETSTVATPTATEAPKECWSEAFGYPCCETSCHIYETDEDGEWGYEDHHWCGIPSTCADNKCWSEKLGYPCCETSCYAYETDANGAWGYENNHWCGILKENC